MPLLLSLKTSESVVGEVDGLFEDVSSKDLRYGSCNSLYVDPQGGPLITAARGGWGQNVISVGSKTGAMVNYLTCLSILICNAGRILAGYKDCAHIYQAPRIHFITDNNKQRTFNFLNSVLYLHMRHPKFNPETLVQ